MKIEDLIKKYTTYHANVKENLSKTLLVNTDEENQSYFDSLKVYSEIIKDLKTLVKDKVDVKIRKTYAKKVIKKNKPFKFNLGDNYKCTFLTKKLKLLNFNLDHVYKCGANSDATLSLIQKYPQGNKLIIVNYKNFQLVQEFKDIKPDFKYKRGDGYICTKLSGHCFSTLNKVYYCVKNSNEYLSIVDDSQETITIDKPETHFRKLDKNEKIEKF